MLSVTVRAEIVYLAICSLSLSRQSTLCLWTRNYVDWKWENYICCGFRVFNQYKYHTYQYTNILYTLRLGEVDAKVGQCYTSSSIWLQLRTVYTNELRLVHSRSPISQQQRLINCTMKLKLEPRPLADDKYPTYGSWLGSGTRTQPNLTASCYLHLGVRHVETIHWTATVHCDTESS